MSLPCPHCGSQETFSDRSPNDFKPVHSGVQSNRASTAVFSSNPKTNAVAIPAPDPGTNTTDTSSPATSTPAVSPAILASPTSPSPPSVTEASAMMTNLIEAVQVLERIEDEQGKFREPSPTLHVDNSSNARLDHLEQSVKKIEADVKAILASQRVLEKLLTEISSRMILKK